MATFDELTKMNDVPEIVVAPRAIDTLHSGGMAERRAANDATTELAAETNIAELASAAIQRNISANLIDTVGRKWTNAPEEGFDPLAWTKENSESLPGVNMEAYASVRSVAEAEELRADQIRAQDNEEIIASKGATGMAVMLLAGMVDPTEIAIGFATGGAGTVARAGTRIGRALQAGANSAIVGARGGLVSGTALHQADPIGELSQVVYGAVGGVVLGGALGTLATRSARRAADAHPTAVKDLPQQGDEPTHVATWLPEQFQTRDDPTLADFTDFKDSPASLGANFRGPVGPFNAAALSPNHRAIYDAAVSGMRNTDDNFGTPISTTREFPDTPVGRTAQRFSDTLANQTWWDDALIDFDRMQQGGTIESHLGYHLLESPEGRLRNNRSAANMQQVYEARLASHSMVEMEDAYTAWQGKSGNFLNSTIETHRPANRTKFDRLVIEELEARFHEGAPVATDVHIKAAADAVDANYAEALNVARGRAGETAIDGFQDIKTQSGFFNHRWNGRGMRAAINRGHSQKDIAAVLDAGYAKANPDMTPEHRAIVAKAVIRRALAKDEGIDVNMLTTLDSDAQDYLRNLLLDSGHSEKTIDDLIESIRGRKEERSQLGTTKARTQVDLRTEINGLSLMDLVDTNLNRTMSQYNRTISGAAALARKGIVNRAQRKQIIDAAMAERTGRNMEAGTKQREFLENIFTHFDSGPIGGGPGELVSRTKKIANLGFLNQMGLTQIAETGAQVAAVGFQTWNRHAKALRREMYAGGPDSPIMRELRPFLGRVGQDHMLFRDDLNLDEVAGAVDLNTFLGKLDFGLGKGQRIQGYASGFFYVRSVQQRIAVASQADKVMQRLRSGVDADILKDVGIDMRVRKYIDNGTVTFDADGFVDQLNLSAWDVRDADNFALALNRHASQVVQKALAGEESMWMHQTMGSFLTHLKSFPLLAMRKQAARTAGVATPLFIATTMMGLATAGIMVDAKQIINGRADEITPMQTLKGAAAMNNVTGWIPMFTDPMVNILGMSGLQFNDYQSDLSGRVMGAPPVFSALNKMAQLPGVLNPLSDLSRNERLRLLQSTPLVGNLYGVSAVLNGMKN
jgi:hypothetical protein